MCDRQVAQVPLADQLGAARGRLRAHREDSAHTRPAQVGEASIYFPELLAVHGAVQSREEHHQRKSSVGASIQRQVVGPRVRR